MTRVLDWFARISTKAPAVTLLALLAITMGFGAAATQLEVDAGMEGFAPEGGIADTLDDVDERFGTSMSVQVLIDAGDGGNVIDADTLIDLDALADELETHPDIAPVLSDEVAGQPAVISYAFPFAQAVEATGESLSDLDDQMLDMVATAIFDNGDDQLKQLFSNDLTTDPPQARSGLLMVDMDADQPLTARNEASRAIQEVVESTEVGDTRRSVMSMTAIEDGVMESLERDMPILMSVSLLLVVLILALLFRSVADVVVGLSGLVASIVWMVGIAAIFGPSVVGWLGPFNQISIAVPVLLVGLGIDYSVHLTTRYREQRSRGDTPERSARTAATTVGVALVLATIASVAGFLANMVTPLPPIRDFGIFAAIGILSAFIVLAAAVPAARTLIDRRADRKAAERDQAARTTQTVAVAPEIPEHPEPPTTNGRPRATSTNGRTPWWVRALTFIATRLPIPALALTLVLVTAGAIAATGLSTEFDDRDFLPEGEPVLRTLDRMEVQFGGEVGEQTFIMVDGDPTNPALLDALAEVEDNLAELDEVRTANDAAQVQSVIMMRDQAVLMGEGVRDQLASDIETWHDPQAAAADMELPDPLDIDAFADDLDGELDLPDELLEALEDRLPGDRDAAVALATTMDPDELEEQIREQMAEELGAERPDGISDDELDALAQLDADELTLAALEDGGYPLDELSEDDREMLEQLDGIEAAGDVDSADGQVLAAQLQVLAELMPSSLEPVVDEHGMLLAVSTTAGYLGADALSVELADAVTPLQAAGGDVAVASEPLLNAEIIEELSDAQLLAIVISLIAVAVLLIIATLVSSRSVALGAIGIVPSVVALALVLGSMRMLDMPFNALTATVASIAVGIGVPYGIHLTNRFRESINEGFDAEGAALDALTNTGPALIGSAATTGLAFAVLMLSTSAPLQQFGVVSTLMIGLAVAGCLLVQPSLLVLWGRYRVGKDRTRSSPDQANEMIKVPEGTKL